MAIAAALHLIVAAIIIDHRYDVNYRCVRWTQWPLASLPLINTHERMNCGWTED